MSRWFDTERDPNSPAAVAARAELVARTRRPPVPKRNPYLQDLARGKRVLDIGVVEHFTDNATRSNWLHKRISEVASSCLGVDVLEDEVAELREQGWNVLVADVSKVPLDEQFDLVLAGEVLEHLDAPGLLFRNVAPMLAPGGRFVLTTPNPYSLSRLWRGARGTLRESVDHVASYTPTNVCELAERAGLRLDSHRGVLLRTLPTARGKLQGAARRLVYSTIFTVETNCDSIIYELVPADQPR